MGLGLAFSLWYPELAPSTAPVPAPAPAPAHGHAPQNLEKQLFCIHKLSGHCVMLGLPMPSLNFRKIAKKKLDKICEILTEKNCLPPHPCQPFYSVPAPVPAQTCNLSQTLHE